MKTNIWADPDTIPVVANVYKRKYSTGEFYSYWDGKRWYASAATPEGAEIAYNAKYLSLVTYAKWRGLLNE